MCSTPSASCLKTCLACDTSDAARYWRSGHVATLPSALKTPGWRKLKSIQSIKLYCKMLQNYILEIYIDLLHIVIWGFLFDLVCVILCFKVVCTRRSEAPRSLWVCAFRCSKRLAADHLHGAWAPTGHKISSEADENGWSDDQKQKSLQMFAVWSDQFNRLHFGFDRPILKLKSLTQGNHLMNQI